MGSACVADGRYITRKRFIVRARPKTVFDELLQTSERALQSGCALCDVASESSPARLYEDDEIIIVHSKHAAGRQHLLVIPKQHIGSIDKLQQTKEDRELVAKMWRVGKEFLRNRDQDHIPEEAMKCGFHEPIAMAEPHLHMHCLVLPHKPDFTKFQFSETKHITQGFITVQQVLERIASPKLKQI